MNSFQLGEKVGLLDEIGFFTVIEIRDEQILLSDDWGMEYWITTKKVVRISALLKGVHVPDDLSEEKEREARTKPTLSKKASHVPKIETVWEIDLHMEKLNPRASLNSKSYQHALAAQLSAFREFMMRARESNQTEVVVIHGSGDGVLKSAVQLELMRMGQTNFHDADPDKYGIGASTVILNWE